MGDAKNQVETFHFVVDETPYCVWGHDLREILTSFLDGFDPTYFDFMAKTFAAKRNASEKPRANLAIRATYGHALETLFATLCATVQAPRGVLAWLLKYRNHELRSLVRKISRKENILTRLKLSPPSWKSLAALIHAPVTSVHSQLNASVERLGDFWDYLASDFLDENHEPEYNSIKHGMRVVTGAFGLRAEPTSAPADGVAATPLDLTGDGSHFKTLLPIAGNKRNLQVALRAKSWSPDALVSRIELISESLSNTVEFLRVLSRGVKGGEQFRIAEDPETYEKCWDVGSSLCNFTFTPNYVTAPENLATEKEILESYD